MRLLFIGIWAAATLQLACNAASEPNEATAKASASSDKAGADEGSAKRLPPLATRFEGAASGGVKSTHLHVGIPAGWTANEWGGVELAKKRGYAAAYDIPTWPPVPAHVALRTKSIGCKGVELAEGARGKLGAKNVDAYFWEAKGTCGGDLKGTPGKPSTLWIAAKKGSDVLIVYLHDDTVDERGKDVPDLIKPFGGA
jgi:hypothetical protein